MFWAISEGPVVLSCFGLKTSTNFVDVPSNKRLVAAPWIFSNLATVLFAIGIFSQTIFPQLEQLGYTNDDRVLATLQHCQEAC
eukprot:Skav213364  [mRNA]  locus=scaffold317:409229:415938:+ [translate_table: standard]